VTRKASKATLLFLEDRFAPLMIIGRDAVAVFLGIFWLS